MPTDRFPGLVLLLSLVIGGYLTVQRLDSALGHGRLVRLLCERLVDLSAPASTASGRVPADRRDRDAGREIEGQLRGGQEVEAVSVRILEPERVSQAGRDAERVRSRSGSR